MPHLYVSRNDIPFYLLARLAGHPFQFYPRLLNSEILWLVQLSLGQNLFTRAQTVAVRNAVGESAELMDFAQKLIDESMVEDLETLEKIAGIAMQKAANGPPAGDPFEADEDDDSGDNAGGDQNGSAVAQVAGASKFAFEKTAKMDEDSLAEAFRGLLKESAAFGASDLHISTGVRPFIRKNRSFSFLSEYVITPEDALRLNTALLSDGQKKIFKERKDYD